MSESDAHAIIRSLIDSSICHLTWHEDACAAAGFEGASQVWKNDPAWYFWLHDVPGAILLRYYQDEAVAEYDYISLVLHYYPRLDSHEYQQLTDVEQVSIADPEVFDQQTGTPLFEQYENCLSEFVAAEIGLLLGSAGEIKTVVFSTGEDLNHPVRLFVDFLIKSWNFYLKEHHQSVKQIIRSEIQSVFLVYDTVAYQEFAVSYALDGVEFTDFPDVKMQKSWIQAASLDVRCSVGGTCSCH